jgi:hypothetical protein
MDSLRCLAALPQLLATPGEALAGTRLHRTADEMANLIPFRYPVMLEGRRRSVVLVLHHRVHCDRSRNTATFSHRAVFHGVYLRA